MVKPVSLTVTTGGITQIPRASLVALAPKRPSSHLAEARLRLISAADRLLDAGRSASDAIGRVVVAAWQGELPANIGAAAVA